MDTRYQVFLSSTYQDLKVERQQVIQALLEFDCIPAGMEFFPAADDSQWELIKRVIKDCDYYIVIVAGRYGTVTAEGISYTQKEYEFALKSGIPVCAFLHKDPLELRAKLVEATEDARKKLSDFRALCENKMCRYWETGQELQGMVIQAINHLKKTRPAVGWIRADKVLSKEQLSEMLSMKDRIQTLEKELQQFSQITSLEDYELAQGDDPLELDISYVHHDTAMGIPEQKRSKLLTTWNELILVLAASLFQKRSGHYLKQAITQRIQELACHIEEGINDGVEDFRIESSQLDRTIIHFLALGWIKQVETTYEPSILDYSPVYQLTDKGHSTILQNLSVKNTPKNQRRPD